MTEPKVSVQPWVLLWMQDQIQIKVVVMKATQVHDPYPMRQV
jgi:hypothetical protein